MSENYFRLVRAALLIACSASSLVFAAPLFTEDWSSGTVDTNKWTLNAGAGYAAVENTTGGLALVMSHPDASFDFTMGLIAKQTFSRGQNIRATFLMWGDNTRQGTGQHYPGGTGIIGPWLKTNTGRPV